MTERWTDEMLDRFAAETRSFTIESRHLIDSNARVIQALANLAAEDAVERREILASIASQQAVIAEQQSEIRGLQTENHRILEQLEQRDRPPENNN